MNLPTRQIISTQWIYTGGLIDFIDPLIGQSSKVDESAMRRLLRRVKPLIHPAVVIYFVYVLNP